MPEAENTSFSGKTDPITIKPVGIVRNKRRNTNWDAGFQSLDWRQKAALMKAQNREISEIVIRPELENALDGIEDFSHIMIIYWAHRAPDEKCTAIKVHPMGSRDLPLVGVFSTHSPARPNSILSTVVELLERKGNILKVTGLDALDDSPVLDIKPHIPYQENYSNVRQPDWIKQVHSEFKDDSNTDTGTANGKG